ncbi:MAG: ferritin-like domain-containing protein [Candidatus Hydrogenedentes bacterium]|nr:ferritin-like domain-containing protein [Candidatus Hydrogenedentota bacterium]
MSPQRNGGEKTLKKLFEDELADVYDAEKRLVKALPKMAKAATDDALRQAIQDHLKQTEQHVTKIESVFESIGKTARGKKCDAMTGLIEEGDSIVADFKGSPAINAAIISAAQKIEHYEIASYGCLSEWAGLMKNKAAHDLLEEILAEEKQADELLTECARNSMNEEALEEDEDMDEDEEDDDDMATDEEDEEVTSSSGRGSSRTRATTVRASGRGRQR